MSGQSNCQREPSNDPTGMIFAVKRFAVHDGPGIRTTVFLKNCPLRCRWCHNPESWHDGPEHSLRTDQCSHCGRCIEACPQDAISFSGDGLWTDVTKCTFCGACVEVCPSGAREIVGRRVTASELTAEIEKDVIFFDESGGGMTFSGGESFMQPEFLEAVAARCKAREIHTALDTTLYADWEVIERVRRYIDLFLCDVKHMDPAEHQRHTGVSNELIFENLRRLARLRSEIIIRIPIIPGVNDDEANLTATAEFVAALGGIHRIDILSYNHAVQGKLDRLVGGYEPLKIEPPSAERMQAIAAKLQSHGFAVKIGG